MFCDIIYRHWSKSDLVIAKKKVNKIRTLLSQIMKELPADRANVHRDYLSPKLFRTELVPGNGCNSIVAKS